MAQERSHVDVALAAGLVHPRQRNVVRVSAEQLARPVGDSLKHGRDDRHDPQVHGRHVVRPDVPLLPRGGIVSKERLRQRTEAGRVPRGEGVSGDEHEAFALGDPETGLHRRAPDPAGVRPRRQGLVRAADEAVGHDPGAPAMPAFLLLFPEGCRPAEQGLDEGHVEHLALLAAEPVLTGSVSEHHCLAQQLQLGLGQSGDEFPGELPVHQAERFQLAVFLRRDAEDVLLEVGLEIRVLQRFRMVPEPERLQHRDSQRFALDDLAIAELLRAAGQLHVQDRALDIAVGHQPSGQDDEPVGHRRRGRKLGMRCRARDLASRIQLFRLQNLRGLPPRRDVAGVFRGHRDGAVVVPDIDHVADVVVADELILQRAPARGLRLRVEHENFVSDFELVVELEPGLRHGARVLRAAPVRREQRDVEPERRSGRVPKILVPVLAAEAVVEFLRHVARQRPGQRAAFVQAVFDGHALQIDVHLGFLDGGEPREHPVGHLAAGEAGPHARQPFRLVRPEQHAHPEIGGLLPVAFGDRGSDRGHVALERVGVRLQGGRVAGRQAGAHQVVQVRGDGRIVVSPVLAERLDPAPELGEFRPPLLSGHLPGQALQRQQRQIVLSDSALVDDRLAQRGMEEERPAEGQALGPGQQALRDARQRIELRRRNLDHLLQQPSGILVGDGPLFDRGQLRARDDVLSFARSVRHVQALDLRQDAGHDDGLAAGFVDDLVGGFGIELVSVIPSHVDPVLDPGLLRDHAVRQGNAVSGERHDQGLSVDAGHRQIGVQDRLVRRGGVGALDVFLAERDEAHVAGAQAPLRILVGVLVGRVDARELGLRELDELVVPENVHDMAGRREHRLLVGRRLPLSGVIAGFGVVLPGGIVEAHPQGVQDHAVRLDDVRGLLPGVGAPVGGRVVFAQQLPLLVRPFRDDSGVLSERRLLERAVVGLEQGLLRVGVFERVEHVRVRRLPDGIDRRGPAVPLRSVAPAVLEEFAPAEKVEGGVVQGFRVGDVAVAGLLGQLEDVDLVGRAPALFGVQQQRADERVEVLQDVGDGFGLGERSVADGFPVPLDVARLEFPVHDGVGLVHQLVPALGVEGAELVFQLHQRGHGRFETGEDLPLGHRQMGPLAEIDPAEALLVGLHLVERRRLVRQDGGHRLEPGGAVHAGAVQLVHHLVVGQVHAGNAHLRQRRDAAARIEVVRAAHGHGFLELAGCRFARGAGERDVRQVLGRAADEDALDAVGALVRDLAFVDGGYDGPDGVLDSDGPGEAGPQGLGHGGQGERLVPLRRDGAGEGAFRGGQVARRLADGDGEPVSVADERGAGHHIGQVVLRHVRQVGGELRRPVCLVLERRRRPGQPPADFVCQQAGERRRGIFRACCFI